jgi:hypothetical protein
MQNINYNIIAIKYNYQQAPTNVLTTLKSRMALGVGTFVEYSTLGAQRRM